MAMRREGLVRKHALLLTLVVLAALVYLACFNSLQVGQHADDAYYVMLAQSLLSGRGYSQIAFPDAPPEMKYPPLLSLLMAPFLWLSGGALWATKLPSLLCTLAAIPVVWFLLGRFVRGPARALLVGLVALHPLVVGYAGMAMSEAPSLLVTWAVLLLALRASEQGGGLKPWLWIGLLLGLGILLRTDVAVLAGAVVLWLLWQRRLAPAVGVALVMLAPVVAWTCYASVSQTVVFGQPYVAAFREASFDPSPLPLRLWQGWVYYIGGALPETVGLVFGDVVEAVAAHRGLGLAVLGLKWLVALCVIVGFARSWKALPGVISVFVALRLAMLIPWFRMARYLLPLLPFLLMFLASGIMVWKRDPDLRHGGRRFAAGLFACLLVFTLGRDAALVLRPPSRNYPDVVAGGALIREHTPPGAVVLCNWNGPAFYLHSGRHVAEVPGETLSLTPEEFVARAPHATHLLLVGPPLQPVALQDYLACPRLRLLAQRPDRALWLFAIRR